MNRDSQKFALVLDVGTTLIKAFVFDEEYNIVAKSGEKIEDLHSHAGHIEQDPGRILETGINVLKRAVNDSGIAPADMAGVGIANQRESVVSWDRKSSQPFYPVILWKDDRTEKYCAQFSNAQKNTVKQKTGLPINPYFSASKINWLINNVPEISLALKEGRLACGTLDSWLIWNLTGQNNFMTDWTNASRTLLYDIKNKKWDEELAGIFKIPVDILPEVKKSVGNFGSLDKRFFGKAVPIKAVCGDQQSSLFAVGTDPGTTKITYGTGVFIMQILGDIFQLKNNFITTIDAVGNYVLEAKVTRGGSEVEAVLDDGDKLRSLLKDIALETDTCVKQLPFLPSAITIDGGVTRDGIIGSHQREVSGLEIRAQKTFDGTALGMAKLVLS